MAKRVKLEVIRDILEIVKDNNNSIRITPLIRKSNLSSQRFYEYYRELTDKGFVNEVRVEKNSKVISLTDKGFRFLEKYKTIIHFIEEFELWRVICFYN